MIAMMTCQTPATQIIHTLYRSAPQIPVDNDTMPAMAYPITYNLQCLSTSLSSSHESGIAADAKILMKAITSSMLSMMMTARRVSQQHPKNVCPRRRVDADSLAFPKLTTVAPGGSVVIASFSLFTTVAGIGTMTTSPSP